MTHCSCYYSVLSPLFLSNHLRSFCASFLLLSILFTFINLLTTTTSINKSTTNEYRNNQTSTSKTSRYPLLLLSLDDIYHNRFGCFRRVNHQRFDRKNYNKNKTSSNPIKIDQPNKTNVEEAKISYDYNTWQSTPLMPRLVTKCEHKLMMQLLKRFDQLATKYSLEYMMIDGTLLGKFFTFFRKIFVNSFFFKFNSFSLKDLGVIMI